MRFSAKIPVRFGDADPAGVVYYPNFFHFFHVVWEEFWSTNGLPLRVAIDRDRIGWPVVSSSASFHQPVPFGSILEVDMGVEKCSTKSVTVRYVGRLATEPPPPLESIALSPISTPRSNLAAVEAQVTAVCIDMQTRQSVPIPNAYRQALERFAWE